MYSKTRYISRSFSALVTFNSLQSPALSLLVRCCAINQQGRIGHRQTALSARESEKNLPDDVVVIVQFLEEHDLTEGSLHNTAAVRERRSLHSDSFADSCGESDTNKAKRALGSPGQSQRALDKCN